MHIKLNGKTNKTQVNEEDKGKEKNWLTLDIDPQPE